MSYALVLNQTLQKAVLVCCAVGQSIYGDVRSQQPSQRGKTQAYW